MKLLREMDRELRTRGEGLMSSTSRHMKRKRTTRIITTLGEGSTVEIQGEEV